MNLHGRKLCELAEAFELVIVNGLHIPGVGLQNLQQYLGMTFWIMLSLIGGCAHYCRHFGWMKRMFPFCTPTTYPLSPPSPNSLTHSKLLHIMIFGYAVTVLVFHFPHHIRAAHGQGIGTKLQQLLAISLKFGWN